MSARHPFGWDYPPGVTGNEPEITGEWEEAVDDSLALDDGDELLAVLDAETLGYCDRLPDVAHVRIYDADDALGCVEWRPVCRHRPGVPTHAPAAVHTYCLDCGEMLS